MKACSGWFLLVALVLAAPAGARADDAPTQLEIYPPKVKLTGPSASQRLVAVAVFADGTRRDWTERVEVAAADAEKVRIEGRKVYPVADGTSELIVRSGSHEVRVPVEVEKAAEPRRVDFRHEVNPVLTRLGCNQGACHGSQHGKGGFRLSLLGFEPADDYTQIVKSAEGRRVSPTFPEESLLLAKPTLAVAHAGGKKLEPGGREYRLLVEWLEQGAPAPADNDPQVTGLAVLPAHRVMDVGESQHLVVMATFSDGAVRDVTDDARFDTLNEGVAMLRPASRAEAVGQGESNLMARYQGRAAMALVTVPYARNRTFDFPAANFIDELAAEKWREVGLVPSPPCTDAEYLRRVMLDVLGTLPTPDEVDAFLADTDPEKQAKLVDRVLDRPEYVDYWTLKWGDLLRVNSDKLGAQGMLAFNLWLREAFRSNRPFDRMVNELVTAQGSIYTNGPANYFRVADSKEELAETTAQVFMGVRLQCAKCHHHPFESYGQDDYYGLTAYFARIGTKNSDEFGLFGREQVIFVARGGEVRQPRTGKVMAPAPLQSPASDDPVDRRRALAKWLTQPDNPWLARNVANRYWGYLLGKGLVNPIDDLRDTNPASIPRLLDRLAQQFVADGYDLQKLLRLILNSRVYQLSARTVPENRLDTTFFTHYTVKRIGAEALLDALNFATGTFEKFPRLPAGTRAIALPDSTAPSYFLDTFGRPERAITCECERSSDPNLSQALHLMNSDLIQRKLSQAESRLGRMLQDPKLTDETLIQTLYKYAFARPATEAEVTTARAIVAEAPDRVSGAQDLLWSLLNSKEFLFNH